MRVAKPAITGTGVVLERDGNVVVDASSFTVPARSITAVIGPNGSGKSTLLDAIAGLTRPIAGNIRFPLFEPAKPRISYVLQTTQVKQGLPVTAGEAVTMGRYPTVGHFSRFTNADRAAITTAMERTGVADIAGRHIGNLSGGQRQRVFVAQGLAQDHDVLLLDEPMTGIDMAAAQAIDEVVHDEINDGCAVVLTTHDLSEAQIADHVILLSGGVVAEGRPGEVLSDDNLAAAYGGGLLHAGAHGLRLDDPTHPQSFNH